MSEARRPRSFLKPGAEFTGLVHMMEPAQIDGRIEGHVISAAPLWIGESARVKARVDAPEIVVEGILEGEVFADRIELRGTSRVRASLETPRLILEEGSFLEGRCRTGASPQPADSSPNSLPRSP